MGVGIGSRLGGRYELLEEEPGAPAYRVFRALDRDVEVSVSLWLVRPDLLPDEASRTRFLEDAKRAREIAHAGLRRIFASGVEGDEAWVAVQRLEAPSLADRARELGGVSDEDVTALGRRLGVALEAARASGLCHGWLRPEDVRLPGGELWTGQGGAVPDVKIGGVGLWGSCESAASRSAFRTVHRHLAPEVRAGETGTVRSDVYSVAVLLGELALGPLPDSQLEDGSWRNELRRRRPRLARVLDEAMAVEAAARPASVTALAELVAGACAPEPEPAPLTPPPVLVGRSKRPSAALTAIEAALTDATDMPGALPVLAKVTAFDTAPDMPAATPPPGLREGEMNPVPTAPEFLDDTEEQELLPEAHVSAASPSASPSPSPSPSPFSTASAYARPSFGADFVSSHHAASRSPFLLAVGGAAIVLLGLLIFFVGRGSSSSKAPAAVGPAAPPVAQKLSPCPRDMRFVEASASPSFCIDAHEAPGEKQQPTVQVTLAQATQACTARGRRLCAGAEWELACRGADGASFPYGTAFQPRRCNVRGKPPAVALAGLFPGCVNPTGIFDMSGNVAEWTADGETRGGSVFDGDEGRCSRVRKRAATSTAPDVGFRCCTAPGAY